MAKTMTIKYDGQEYTLEYTRNSIKKMEAKGFEIDKVASKPMTMLPALFEGAFLAHHSNVAPSKISEIFADLPDKEKLVDMLTFLIPNYVKEGKNRLVVAIGCTGGRHRSVTIANALYGALKDNSQFGMKLFHRDLNSQKG